MIRELTITESVSSTLRLSNVEAQQLKALGKRLASSQSWWGDVEPTQRTVIECFGIENGLWQVRVREAVGVISAGDLQLVVKPKIPIEHFLYLASWSPLFPRIDEQDTKVERGEHLWEILAKWFLAATEGLLRRELAKGYVEVEDVLDAARGRIIPLETARLFYTGCPQIACEFEDFNQDIALNRVIKRASELVAGSTRLESADRRRAKAILARMSDVGELTLVDMRAHVDRLTQHYKSSLSFAKCLIAGCASQIEHGAQGGWAYLLRTPDIVETGVREVLVRALSKRWRIGKEQLRLGQSRLTLNPDLVVNDGVVIGDVKYKHAEAEWSRSDLYQITAFGTGFRSKAAFIINFGIADVVAPTELYIGDLKVKAFSWNARTEMIPEQAAGEISDELTVWLDSLDFERKSAAA